MFLVIKSKDENKYFQKFKDGHALFVESKLLAKLYEDPGEFDDDEFGSMLREKNYSLWIDINILKSDGFELELELIGDDK